MADIAKLTYHNFEIELSDLQPDGMFKVRVLGTTPDGHQMSADDAETTTYVATEFDTPVRKLALRRLDKNGLLQLGEKLGNLMLPGRVRTLFEQSLDSVRAKKEGLRLRLRVEPLPLAALPWEYALTRRNAGESTPQDFLCLQPDISIVRHIVLGDPLPATPPKAKYKAVVALASPQGQTELELGKDEQVIRDAVRAIDPEGEIVDLVVLYPAERQELLDALEGADIFHFSGHSVFDQQSEFGPDGNLYGKGGILLEKEDGSQDLYGTELLANALQRANVRMAGLGGCESAARDAGGAWSGVAPGLVRLNVPAVVAMQFKLADARAPQLFAPLYLLTLQGYTVDQAVAEARIALFNQTGQAEGDWAKDRDWGTLVLYLRAPDGVLFPEPETTTVERSDGTRVITASQKIKKVSGNAVVVKVDEIQGGVRIEAKQDIGEVTKGGDATTVKIGRIG